VTSRNSVNTPAEKPPRQTFVRMELSVRTAIIAVGTIATVWLFLQLWQILLVIVGALMIVGMLNPFVDKLEQRGVSRGYAIAIVFVALFVLVGGFCALTVPALVTQLADVVENLPKSQAKLVTVLEHSKLTAPFASSVRAFHPNELGKKAQELGFTYGPKIIEIGAYAVTAFFLALYLMIDRDRMRGALFALIPRSYHLRTSRVLMNLETIVGGYMRGQVFTSLLMAVFTFGVLMIAGVPNALALALFAGLADVLPYIGALLACGPAVLAALSKGTTTAIVVLVVLAAYQELESRVIVPRVYGKVLRLPPASVMIALLVGGKLLGILGALLALPIAAAIRMIISEMRVELPGEEVDDGQLRAKDAVAEREFAVRAAGHPAVEAAAIATEIAVERRDEDAHDADQPGEVVNEPITSGAT
jgi:predicted PurR-regulated permease PerM